MQPDVVRRLLPWAHPFLMIDRVLSCEPPVRIVASRNVTASDPLTQVPGPEGPGLPGTLVVEGMSQSAAVLFQQSYQALPPGAVPLLGSLRASWDRPARPGEVLVFTVTAVKMTSRMGIFLGEASVDGVRIAEAELAFSVAEMPGDGP